MSGNNEKVITDKIGACPVCGSRSFIMTEFFYRTFRGEICGENLLQIMGGDMIYEEAEEWSCVICGTMASPEAIEILDGGDRSLER